MLHLSWAIFHMRLFYLPNLSIQFFPLLLLLLLLLAIDLMC